MGKSVGAVKGTIPHPLEFLAPFLAATLSIGRRALPPVRKKRCSSANQARRKSRFSGVQALESSQFTGGAEEIFPERTPPAKQRGKFRKRGRDLGQREKPPDLIHPRLAHDPGGGASPLRWGRVRQTRMQARLGFGSIPREGEIIGR